MRVNSAEVEAVAAAPRSAPTDPSAFSSASISAARNTARRAGPGAAARGTSIRSDLEVLRRSVLWLP